MNKKGSGMILFLIIGVVILIAIAIGIFVVAVIINEKPITNETITSTNTKLLLRSFAEDINNYTDANYSLEYNGIIYKSGRLNKNSFTEINAPVNQSYHLLCWNDEYYKREAVFIVGDDELNQLICRLNQRKGNLNISYTGELNNKNNIIKLKIDTENHWKKNTICFGWSAGIIDAGMKEQTKECNQKWLNFSEYFPENKTYTYYQNSYIDGEGLYRCPDDDNIEICRYTIGGTCRVKNIEIPPSYKSKVDHCVYTGENINNETKVYDVEVKMLDERSFIDSLDIYVLDQDRIKVSSDPHIGYQFFTEFQGVNLGIPKDYHINIPYTGIDTY